VLLKTGIYVYFYGDKMCEECTHYLGHGRVEIPVLSAIYNIRICVHLEKIHT
jgi:hypothetical protein